MICNTFVQIYNFTLFTANENNTVDDTISVDDDVDENAGPCSKEFKQKKIDEKLALTLESGGHKMSLISSNLFYTQILIKKFLFLTVMFSCT